MVPQKPKPPTNEELYALLLELQAALEIVKESNDALWLLVLDHIDNHPQYVVGLNIPTIGGSE